VKAGHRRHPLARQKRSICRDIPRCPESRVLLAMQKVVGSNPISRSPKALDLRGFSLLDEPLEKGPRGIVGAECPFSV
jgi:hypothetical protein